MSDGLEVVAFPDQPSFEQWLEQAHAAAPGFWLKFAKKNTGVASVGYEEAVETALCFGWIDGLTRRLDETYYVIRFTPRRKRSNWSKSNVDRVTALAAAGRMRAAGQVQVDLAKQDGRWDAANG